MFFRVIFRDGGSALIRLSAIAAMWAFTAVCLALIAVLGGAAYAAASCLNDGHCDWAALDTVAPDFAPAYIDSVYAKKDAATSPTASAHAESVAADAPASDESTRAAAPSSETAGACVVQMRRYEVENNTGSGGDWATLKTFLETPDSWKDGVSDETLLRLVNKLPDGEGFSACGQFLDELGRGSPRHCAIHIAGGGNNVYRNVLADAVRKIDVAAMTDEEQGNWYRARFGNNRMPGDIASNPCRDLFAEPASDANADRRNEWALELDNGGGCASSWDPLVADEMSRLYQTPFNELTKREKGLMRENSGGGGEADCDEYFPQLFTGYWVIVPDPDAAD